MLGLLRTSITATFRWLGAAEKTRTSTGVTPQRPQRCASTNSATAAEEWAGKASRVDVANRPYSDKSNRTHLSKYFQPLAQVFLPCKTDGMSTQSQNRNTLASDALYNPSLKTRWTVLEGLSDYENTTADMEKAAEAIRQGNQAEQVWLVEHPPLYTGGTRAQDTDLLEANRFPVFSTGRGGEYTYHGPGQRVAYAMINLSNRVQDVRFFVATLEQWVINTLDQFNIKGERREDRVGVWVQRPDKPPLPDGTPREDKIAAIGIRVRKWVTFHGISLNVEPDLGHYSGIVPCGVEGHGVTSLVDLGLPVTMEDVDIVLRREFEKLFGPTQ